MIEKIRAYLGFCLRAGKIIFGVDDIETHRKKIHLLLVDEKLAENSKKRLHKANERFLSPLFLLDEGLLGELLLRPQVKAVAIKDYNLAKAILQAAKDQPQFKFYSGGNN
ncbi:MAG: hypothetical protein IJY11_04130 [Clostridia bacterium]|nr:hypothetical protein [Clostridia bacterium]